MATLTPWYYDLPITITSKLFKYHPTHIIHTVLFLTEKLVWRSIVHINSFKKLITDQNLVVDTLQVKKEKLMMTSRFISSIVLYCNIITMLMFKLKVRMIKRTGVCFNKHIMITNLEAGIESVQLYWHRKIKIFFFIYQGS